MEKKKEKFPVPVIAREVDFWAVLGSMRHLGQILKILSMWE